MVRASKPFASFVNEATNPGSPSAARPNRGARRGIGGVRDASPACAVCMRSRPRPAGTRRCPPAQPTPQPRPRATPSARTSSALVGRARKADGAAERFRPPVRGGRPPTSRATATRPRCPPARRPARSPPRAARSARRRHARFSRDENGKKCSVLIPWWGLTEKKHRGAEPGLIFAPSPIATRSRTHTRARQPHRPSAHDTTFPDPRKPQA